MSENTLHTYNPPIHELVKTILSAKSLVREWTGFHDIEEYEMFQNQLRVFRFTFKKEHVVAAVKLRIQIHKIFIAGGRLISVYETEVLLEWEGMSFILTDLEDVDNVYVWSRDFARCLGIHVKPYYERSQSLADLLSMDNPLGEI